jgi:hypothetical protein
VPVVCFTELVQIGLWAIWAEQHAVHSISAQTNQEGIKCKGKSAVETLCIIFMLQQN